MSEVGKQIEKRTKEYAMKVIKELKELNSDLGPKYWTQARLIFEVDEKALWQVAGFETRQAFRDKMFISKSTWHDKLRTYGWAKAAMEKELLTLAQLNRLPSQNVKQLLRMDTKRQFAAAWITKALTMTEADLEAQVDQVIVKQTEEAEESDDSTLNQPESRTLFKESMTVSQKKWINAVMDKFAEQEEIPKDDRAKILELVMAEINSGLEEPVDEDLVPAATASDGTEARPN